MLNQTILVGRLVSDPELQELENGEKIANITLAIPRSYKNMNGEYDTDFIEITLYNAVAQNTCEYGKKGDLIGAKGNLKRLSTDEQVKIVAGKITFLTSKS